MHKFHSLQPFPNLALVVSVTFETLKNKLYTECGEQSFDTRSFMEGLFRLFFSQYQSCFKEEDCRWFLEQANQHTSYVSQDHDDSPKSPGSTDPLHACGTEGIFKLYLSRILKESDVERGNNILRLHNPKVWFLLFHDCLFEESVWCTRITLSYKHTL